MALAIVAALLGSAGCRLPKASELKPSKLFSLDSTWPFGDYEEPDKGIPQRVVGTWTDTIMTTPGQKPQRGFGGRLVFYGSDEKKPILVDGQLVVYAFDESGRDPTDNKPTRRYVFPPDQMPRHMSISEVGASYSFWLPWDEAGGPKTEVSLICRFEPKGGAVIASEQTHHMLPGSLPAAALASREPPKLPEGVPVQPARPTLQSLQNKRHADTGAQQAVYEAPAESPPGGVQTSVDTATLVPDRRLGVTSITLPDNFNFGTADASTASANRNRTALGKPAAPAVPRSAQPMQLPPVTPAAAPGVPQSVQPAAHAPPPALNGMPTTSTGALTPQLARPQLVAPQWMALQPAPQSAGLSTTVSYPQQAAQQQPATR